MGDEMVLEGAQMSTSAGAQAPPQLEVPSWLRSFMENQQATNDALRASQQAMQVTIDELRSNPAPQQQH
jgi:hypothetical protein